MTNNKRECDNNVDYSLLEQSQSQEGPSSLTLQAKLEAYQRIIREWAVHLTIHELGVLMQIADRTIGWGQHSATMSAGSIMNGGGAYQGMQIGRTKLFEVLKSLEEKQIIKRRKSGAGSLRISINPGWTPAMLNMPKRVKEGKSQSAVRTTPSATRTDPSVSRTLYTGNLYTDNLNTDTAAPDGGGKVVSEKMKSPSGKKEKGPSPQSPPSKIVRSKIESAQQANRSARQTNINRTRGRTDVATGIEATWRTALEETFPQVSHAVWDVRIKRNVKLKAKEWAFGSQITFDDIFDWSVRNWSRIIKKQFGWMKQKAPPTQPDIGFFLYFSPKFMEAWADREFQEWLRDPERSRLDKLMVKGATREEAEAQIIQDRAEERMADRNRESEEKAAQMRREARMVRKQARDIADRANVPPRRRQKPSPEFQVRDVDPSELIVPQVPKKNPFDN